jgi:RNA polymerase sigma-70 factor (ECF subfamily)
MMGADGNRLPNDAAEGAFERYRQYLLMLARVAIDPRLQGKVDASDIVQQTLLEAHQCRDRAVLEHPGEVAAWLRRILSNNLADVLRGLARAKRDVARQRSLDDELSRSSDRLASWLAADQSSPSQHAAREERALALAAALAELPEGQREALILQYWHGWSLAQIAAHMNRSAVAVAGLLKRGIRALRERLAAEGGERAEQLE